MRDRRECRANSSGHTLYRWTDGQGQEWACCAYDHGPFCRLCTQVADEITAALLDNVESGYLEVWTEPNGEFRFTFTQAGRDHADHLVDELVEDDLMQQRWRRLIASGEGLSPAMVSFLFDAWADGLWCGAAVDVDKEGRAVDHEREVSKP
jgi:hypothetical protein